MRRKVAALLAVMLPLLLFLSWTGGSKIYAEDRSRYEKADEILIEKGVKRMMLLRKGRVLKTYRVALGRNPVGPKIHKGDGRTPEGFYRIDYRNPGSAFHLALHISYPNQSDLERAKALGVPPGGDIMIHGLRKGPAWVSRVHYYFNWTEGCIAVTNKEMDEIWRLVPNGTRVVIRP